MNSYPSLLLSLYSFYSSPCPYLPLPLSLFLSLLLLLCLVLSVILSSPFLSPYRFLSLSPYLPAPLVFSPSSPSPSPSPLLQLPFFPPSQLIIYLTCLFTQLPYPTLPYPTLPYPTLLCFPVLSIIPNHILRNFISSQHQNDEDCNQCM